MTRRFRFYEVKRVFLACPGDLVAERSRFPRLLETVNNLRAHSLGFHLEPVGWERVIPSFGRPQDLINSELQTADLVVVMFWNRIGSPSAKNRSKTGTIEEYELARQLYEMHQRPLVWVYFRRPTETEGDQVEQVLSFRKVIEAGKDIFFREYSHSEEWEAMAREHLVAYLDGLRRWNVDRNRESMRPELALLRGNFIAEGIWEPGRELTFLVDLDGDGNEELIRFKIDGHGVSFRVLKDGAGLPLGFPEEWDLPFDGDDGESFGTLWAAKVVHIAVKDVTNDGLPEIIVAAQDGVIGLRVAVWGFVDPRGCHDLADSCFRVLAKFEGQCWADVHEGGCLLFPYGTAGLFTEHRWNGTQFCRVEDKLDMS